MWWILERKSLRCSDNSEISKEDCHGNLCVCTSNKTLYVINIKKVIKEF